MVNEEFPVVTVIGAGLAGCEAALQLAARGVPVRLIEMRPERSTPVHKTGDVAELVCSNSFKSVDPETAAGSLKYELSVLGSKLLACAFDTRVAAGGALAVDRNEFSAAVQRLIDATPNIEFVREECTSIPEGPAIIATGPLTADALASQLAVELGSQGLAFYDAAAPIVEADSIDRSVVFAQSRYDKGGTADYLNAPFTKEEYEAFVDELVAARRVIEKDFERRELFAACQPVEEVARTGRDALSHGALKPVGLTDPRTGRRPWAAVQLRAENAAATAYNLVGFQTNLTFPEQQRVFRMIPGLEQAEFMRYGVMHRNTFLNSPTLLNADYSVRIRPNLFFAGQITGVEGYMESASSGILAGINALRRLRGECSLVLPEDTMTGALSRHVAESVSGDFQPMGANFGVLPPIEPHIRDKKERYKALAERGLSSLETCLAADREPRKTNSES